MHIIEKNNKEEKIKAFVITHKETEFDFFSSELALQQMLFFVIFM